MGTVGYRWLNGTKYTSDGRALSMLQILKGTTNLATIIIKGGLMKTQIRNFIIMTFISLSLCGIIAFSGTVLAGENVYKATDNEELFGTWVNMDYGDEMHAQMINFKLGEYGLYSSANDSEPMWTAEYRISQKRTDAKGNIWYEYRWKAGAMGSGFSLLKISDSGKTIEYIFSQWEIPKELDINNENYRTYNRK
jgi:hypothetical protein